MFVAEKLSEIAYSQLMETLYVQEAGLDANAKERSLFAELTEGLEALAANREGKIALKTDSMVLAAPGPIEPSESMRRRVGFLAGEITVPDDFNEMGEDEISQLFGGGS